jgi:hypothetical protein
MPEKPVSSLETSPAVAVARAALLEITLESDVGALVSEQTNDEGVSTILFASSMLGYPDWFWTVSVAQLPGEEPTVLEAELMPGEGALIAPDWVPWADRLEDYKAAQAAIAAGELAAGGDDESDDDDDDDDESDDDDAIDDDDSDDDDSDDDDSDDDDDDDDDEHDDDDLGDDPDDGIDFESDEALAGMPSPVGVDEQDQADAEPDESRPEPPAAPVRKQRAKKQQ